MVDLARPPLDAGTGEPPPPTAASRAGRMVLIIGFAAAGDVAVFARSGRRSIQPGTADIKGWRTGRDGRGGRGELVKTQSSGSSRISRGVQAGLPQSSAPFAENCVEEGRDEGGNAFSHLRGRPRRR